MSTTEMSPYQGFYHLSLVQEFRGHRGPEGTIGIQVLPCIIGIASSPQALFLFVFSEGLVRDLT